jgi:signal transduction histidine kinase
LKFSPKNTVVTISSSSSDKRVVVSVDDQGIGLTSEQGARVFDKFYQAKSDTSVKGFGLGLAICKLIVDSHGGTIGVQSTYGKGSRFWFSLEAAAPDLLPEEEPG